MRCHVGILLLACIELATPLCAETITVNSIRFESEDTDAIQAYLSSREQFHAAEKYYASVTEGYTKKTATIHDYTRAKEEFVAARKKIMLLECHLNIVPTLPDGDPNGWSKNEMRQQWAEATKITELLPVMKDMLDNKPTYEQELRRILARFRGHAAEGVILLALGDVGKETPDVAIKCYTEAAKCRVLSDLYGFAQQSAWQRLAQVYERTESYQEAVGALQNWKISEPCGTGADGSRIEKSFKIWELKLHYLYQDTVFRELWEALESGHISFGCGESLDGLAQRVRLLYQGAGSSALKSTVERLQNRYPVEGDSRDIRPGAQFARFLAELTSQLQFLEDVDKATLQQCLIILRATRTAAGAPSIHGGLSNLTVPHKNIRTPLWREEVLITRLVSFPAKESVPALIASDSERHDCCALFALGKIGGEEAVQYLTRKAKDEVNVRFLHDYHFCLLLTADEVAATFVRQAEAEGSGNNRAAAAWALDEFATRSRENKNIGPEARSAFSEAVPDGPSSEKRSP